MSVNLNERGISYGAYPEMLNNLQANILKSHDRRNCRLLFLQFTGSKSDVKAWIRSFVADFKVQHGYVFSAAEQKEDSKNFKKNKAAHVQKIVLNFYLSGEGYKYLGFPVDKLDDNGNKAFVDGMKSPEVQETLSDPPFNRWEAGYDKVIHAMISLADSHQDLTRIDVELDAVKQTLNNVATVLKQETGKAITDADDFDIEHFGYRDGLSQPRYFEEDIKEDGKVKISTEEWNPLQPLKIILVKDPFAESEDNYGSFLVYRKLEQHVEDFNKEIVNLAKGLELNDVQLANGVSKAQFAGAQVVGRFKDGTALEVSEKPVKPADPVLNDFDYGDDSNAKRCPFHAHIRKTNPRGQGSPIIPKRFLTRRGMPYGNPNNAADKKGLLFMCLQSNLKDQFNFIQETWVNSEKFNPSFFGLGTILGRNPGIDPLIGQEIIDKPEDKNKQGWPIKYGEREEVKFPFSGFIQMQGGEYFFAPSIGFLKKIESV